MKRFFLPLMALALVYGAGCQSKSQTAQNSETKDSVTNVASIEQTENQSTPVDTKNIKVADAKTILERPQVPILCYHQVRNWKPTDGKVGKDYIVEIENFKNHIKMLVDSGYNTILPDQLYAYLNEGKPLPKNQSCSLLMILIWISLRW